MDEGKDNPQSQVAQMNDEIRNSADARSLEEADKKGGPWEMVRKLFGINGPAKVPDSTLRLGPQGIPNPVTESAQENPPTQLRPEKQPVPVQTPTTKAA